MVDIRDELIDEEGPERTARRCLFCDQHADSYRVDRTTPLALRAVAFVIRVRNRLGNPLGWKLKPLVTMQGPRNRVCPAASDAFASTKLMPVRQAQAAIDVADAIATGDAR